MVLTLTSLATLTLGSSTCKSSGLATAELWILSFLERKIAIGARLGMLANLKKVCKLGLNQSLVRRPEAEVKCHVSRAG